MKDGEVLSILASMTEYYKKLLALVEKEISSMQKDDLKSMQSLLEQKLFVITKIEQLEKNRIEILGPDGSWVDYANTLNEPDRDNFLDARKNLLKIIFKIKELNEITKIMASSSLAYVEKVFTLTRQRQQSLLDKKI